MGDRYRAEALIAFAHSLFAAAGMPDEMAATVARILVEADLMGHDTHGLALAPTYLQDLADGKMRATGDVITVSDRKAAIVWDGNRLSGVWLTARAIDLASERARDYGIATIVIREAHHIACLAAYLTRATDKGQAILILSSNPAVATVAPYGGLDAVFTPDPFAAGFPTGGDPILIDMSASITTNGLAARRHAAGQKLPGKWMLDHQGNATDDPSPLFAKERGTLLPTGGLDHGHKGFGLALIVEALTQGLSGLGRSGRPGFSGASVFVQVLEPELFAGRDAFIRETQALVDLSRASRPAPGVEGVRLPGERALARKRKALADGVTLFPGILDKLKPWAERFAVPPPLAV
jgi:LDH2 family malate/lactate/ureidoglycolate dehydrogenase